MTIIVKIKDGSKYTLWNVTEYHQETPSQLRVKHSDRLDSIIQGYIQKIERKD